MKKQYAIFLVLIICAAMVGSSTLVIVLNMPIIAQASQRLQAEAGQPSESNQAIDTQTAPGQASQNPKVVAMEPSNQNSAPMSTEFTPAEKEQIAQMLNDLGVQDKDISSDTIKNFQSQNSLSPTGNMDANTLNEIIRQLSLVKAQAAMGT
ncbi:MAG: hypothetical protein ABRQ26_15030 [Syntrophomonadaceae bacterium]